MTTPEALAFADAIQELEDKSLTQYDCERLANLSSAEIDEAKFTFKTALRNSAPTALRTLAARVRELEAVLVKVEEATHRYTDDDLGWYIEKMIKQFSGKELTHANT